MKQFLNILKEKNPHDRILELFNVGKLKTSFPELYALHTTTEKGHKNNFYHTLGVIKNVVSINGDFKMILVAVLHDIGKPESKKSHSDKLWTFHNHEAIGAIKSKEVLRSWGVTDEKLISYVFRMINSHGRIKMQRDVSESAIRRLDKSVGEDIIFDLIDFCKCDITTSNDEKRDRIVSSLNIIKNRIVEVRAKDEDGKWRSPITGYVIMEILGKDTPGKIIGEIKAFIDPKIKSGEWSEEDGINYIKKPR